jgi:hypothetical protein
LRHNIGIAMGRHTLSLDFPFHTVVTRISLVSTMVRRTHEQGSSIKHEKECAEL